MLLSYTLEMRDKLTRNAKRMTKSLTGMARTGTREISKLNRAANRSIDGMEKLGNRYTGLFAGAGMAAGINNVGNMQRRLTYLGIQANKSADQIKHLSGVIYSTAQMKDVAVAPEQLLDAIEKIVEKTGDFQLAQDNIRNIGLAVRASNSQGMDIGAMIADLSEKFNIDTSDGLLAALDLLVNQGKAGAFTLQNLATQGERVTAAYAATGRQGLSGIREMGAMLQVIKKGTGPAEQAATAFEALLRTLADGKKRKLLESGGIRITDPDDPKRMRAVTEIYKDIIRKTDGDVSKLSAIFDGEAMRAFTFGASQFSQGKGFEALDGFFNQASDGTQIVKDATTAVDQYEGAMTKLTNAFKNAAFKTFEKPLLNIVKAINSMDAENLERIIQAMSGLILGGGLLVGGRKLLRTGAGAAVAGAIGKKAITKVPYGHITAPSTMKHGRRALRMSKAGVARAVGGGAGLGIAIDSTKLGHSVITGDRENEFRAAGALSGTFGGMAAGAAAGSVVPVIGTAIGAGVGAILGAIIGEAVGDKAAENHALKTQQSDVGGQMDINVHVTGGTAQVTANGRPNSDKMQYHITGDVTGGL